MLALAHYHAKDYEAAVSRAREGLRLNDVRAGAVLAASLARLGRIDEARAAMPADVQRRATLAGRRLIPYAQIADFQDLLEGLRLAGLGAPFAARLEGDLDPGRE
jgi:hypothetical protein